MQLSPAVRLWWKYMPSRLGLALLKTTNPGPWKNPLWSNEKMWPDRKYPPPYVLVIQRVLYVASTIPTYFLKAISSLVIIILHRHDALWVIFFVWQVLDVVVTLSTLPKTSFKQNPLAPELLLHKDAAVKNKRLYSRIDLSLESFKSADSRMEANTECSEATACKWAIHRKCVRHIDSRWQPSLPEVDTEVEQQTDTQQSDPALGPVTPLAEPHQYPSFCLLTLKTTGHDGNCMKPKGSIRRLPAWPCFLDRAEEQNPYVRQCNALWSIPPQWYLTERRERAHTRTDTQSDLRTGLSGWPLWQMKRQQWHRVCFCQSVLVCVCVFVYMHLFASESLYTWMCICFLFCLCARPVCPTWHMTHTHASTHTRMHTHTHTPAISHSLSLVQMACWSFLFYSVLMIPQYWVSGLAGTICLN